jgi:hypothetical protein
MYRYLGNPDLKLVLLAEWAVKTRSQGYSLHAQTSFDKCSTNKITHFLNVNFWQNSQDGVR